MASPSTLLVFARQTLTSRFILFSGLFSALFLSLSMILINILNFISIGSAPYELLVKVRIMTLLFFGSFQSVSGLDLLLLLAVSMLFGLNLGIVIKKYRFMRSQGNLQLTIGTGLISLGAAGCASCGLSVMSLVGLGAALTILPFGGLELYAVAIAILFASLLYNLNSLYQACKI